jgi:hypothetical protein
VSEALRLERMLSRFHKTTVINSNVNFNYGKWINVNDGYFAEQWNTLLQNIDDDTDYVFHIQADATVTFNQLDTLFYRFKEAARQYKIGVYAPDVDYTPCKYDLSDLVRIPITSAYGIKYLHRVPCTDCTCWIINTELMTKKPLFDLSVNSMGWGTDFYYIAKACLEEYETVRDYQVTISHPKKNTYSYEIANEQFKKWLFLQDEDIFMTIGILFNTYCYMRKN